MYALINKATWELVKVSESYRHLCPLMPADETPYGIAPAATILEPANIGKVDTFTLVKFYENLTGVKWRGAMLVDALKTACYEIILSKVPSGKDPEEIQPKPAVTKETQAQPNNRPKAGTATGSVWESADRLYPLAAKVAKDLKAQTNWKSLLMAVREDLPGVNPATVQVQFGKWKASKLEELDLTKD